MQTNHPMEPTPVGHFRSAFAVDIISPAWLSSRHYVQMNIPVPNRVSVTVNLTFRESFIASLTLNRYHGARIILYTIFPLAGLFLLVFPFCIGRRPSVLEVLMALLAFSFIPLITAQVIWRNRRNKLAQGPFTYSFDSEGMHTSGGAFAQTIKWPAIPRVRQSKHFLFVFISPVIAHCIPLKALSDQGVLDEVRNIVGQHTDLR